MVNSVKNAKGFGNIEIKSIEVCAELACVAVNPTRILREELLCHVADDSVDLRSKRLGRIVRNFDMDLMTVKNHDFAELL